MKLKAKIGILFVTSGWFREVGLQSADSDTSANVQRLAEQTVDRLRAFLDPVFDGVLFSIEEAQAAAERMRGEGIDGLLLSPLMWCEDGIVRAALNALPDLPILLWTFSPQAAMPEFLSFQEMIQGSGAVCTLQLSGMLKREGRRYRSVVGHFEDERVYEEIGIFTLGMAIVRVLKSTRVGVLPFPCDHMSTTYVDEFGLRSRYGIELRYLELERFRREAQAVEDGALQAFRFEIEGDGTVIEVDDRNLEEGIRYALAMERILAEEQLDVLAMNDVIDEMHQSLGLRPCLSNPRIAAAGRVVSMEADIAAGVAMHILRLFTGQAPMYTETFSVDYTENALLLGHAGYHDAGVREPGTTVRIVPDVEYENSDRFTGAVSFFKFRSGPVTVVNSVWDGQRLKWVVVEGESLPGPDKMEGNSHLFCRLGPQVEAFFRTAVESGVSQHWIVVPGHRGVELERLCDQLDIGFEAV